MNRVNSVFLEDLYGILESRIGSKVRDLLTDPVAKPENQAKNELRRSAQLDL